MYKRILNLLGHVCFTSLELYVLLRGIVSHTVFVVRQMVVMFCFVCGVLTVILTKFFRFCSIDSIVCSYAAHSVTGTQRADANVLAECLRIQDGTPQLPDGFLHSDVADVVMHLCTSDF